MIPILLCGQGRSGTTALMRLFSTSEAIFCDKIDHEKRYLTYWAKLADLLNRDVGNSEFPITDLANFDVCRLGRFPWYYDDHYSELSWPPSAAEWLAAFWRAFSALVHKRNSCARFYAEKSSAWVPALVRECLPCEVMYLMRDPRDVYISSQMYQEKDTSFLGGMENAHDENELAHYIAFGFINIYENYLADKAKPDTTCILYEDFVCSFQRRVAELENRFHVRLDVAESRIGWSLHGTAPALAASVRRWDGEALPARVQRKIIHCVGREMMDLGYDTAGTPASNGQTVTFSIGQVASLPPLSSEDGVMTLEEDCARIEVFGSDYWFVLPLEGFDASGIDHIWLCLSGGAGNHCSIYWRKRGEEFSQERSFHVEYRASNCWRVLDFPVYRHSQWTGAIEELRIDVFNRADQGFGRQLSATPECHGTGKLRWVRLLSVAAQDSTAR